MPRMALVCPRSPGTRTESPTALVPHAQVRAVSCLKAPYSTRGALRKLVELSSDYFGHTNRFFISTAPEPRPPPPFPVATDATACSIPDVLRLIFAPIPTRPSAARWTSRRTRNTLGHVLWML